MLDARKAVGVTQRTGYIARVRNMAKGLCRGILEDEEGTWLAIT